jgi:hypothetical protein
VAKFAQDCHDVDFEVKCFFSLLFNGVLMTHTSPYISSGVIGYVENLALIGKLTGTSLHCRMLYWVLSVNLVFKVATLLVSRLPLILSFFLEQIFTL